MTDFVELYFRINAFQRFFRVFFSFSFFASNGFDILQRERLNFVFSSFSKVIRNTPVRNVQILTGFNFTILRTLVPSTFKRAKF